MFIARPGFTPNLVFIKNKRKTKNLLTDPRIFYKIFCYRQPIKCPIPKRSVNQNVFQVQSSLLSDLLDFSHGSFMLANWHVGMLSVPEEIDNKSNCQQGFSSGIGCPLGKG